MAIPKNPFEGKHVIQADDPIRTKLDKKMNSGEDPAKLEAEFDTKIKSKMNNATS